VILRKVPGALALGLLASLVAHAALYGGEHAMGGGYHALFVQAAITGVLGLLVGFGALAWSGAGGTADGSILAARLSSRLPGGAAILASASLWFALCEGVEPHHAGAAPWLMVLCLIAASWIVKLLARGVVACLARAVFAITRLTFSPRTPNWTRRPRLQPIRHRVVCTRRRFARPPPSIASTVRA
jgi:hypothetical protein